MVKNPPANVGDVGSVPGSGRSSDEGSGNHSTILSWRIPWTEDAGGLYSKRVRHDLVTKPQILFLVNINLNFSGRMTSNSVIYIYIYI